MHIKEYFSTSEWENFVEYDKVRLSNMYDNYCRMRDLGFDPPPPDFVVEYEKKRKREATNLDAEDEPAAKKLATEIDQVDLKLSQSFQETLQVSQNDKEEPALPQSNSPEKTSAKSSEEETNSNNATEESVSPKNDIEDDNRRVTRSRKKLLDESQAVNGNSGRKSYSMRESARDKNYVEYSSPDEDDYEFCDECDTEHFHGCPTHGSLKHIPDTPAGRKIGKGSSNEEYAMRTIPAGLKVTQSAIENAGLGVWTTNPIPGGCYFGPYKGAIVSNLENGDYAWEIKYQRKQSKSRFIDGSDASKSNWMRYVNSARNFTEQNLIAYQYKKKIYYRVPSEIPANKELYVYYGNKYARDLDIDTHRFFQAPEYPPEVAIFPCSTCGTKFFNPIERDAHLTNNCGPQSEKLSSDNNNEDVADAENQSSVC